MKICTKSFDKKFFAFLSFFMVLVIISVGSVFGVFTTTAAAEQVYVTADDSYSWSNLKDDIDALNSGDILNVDIERSSTYYPNSVITIKKGTTVNLVRTSAATSTYDIRRGATYQNINFFVVKGTLNVQCIMTGSNESDNIAYDDTKTQTSLIKVNDGGKLNIKNNAVLMNSYSKYGGAVYNNGTVTMTGGEIKGCFAGNAGGGIYNATYGNFKLTNGKIHDNEAWGWEGVTAGAGGGGVYNTSKSSSCKIFGGEIYKNEAINGGGVMDGGSYGTFEMTGGMIYQNIASGDGDDYGRGGGIYFARAGEVPYITGGLINRNEAKQGGGIYSARDYGLSVENNENNEDKIQICYNIARGNGGGIFAAGGTVWLDEISFYQNFAYGETKPNDNFVNTGCGGGIYVGNDVQLLANNCWFNNNYAQNNGSYTEKDNSVGRGGGIYITSVGGETHSIFDSFIYNNIAEIGGGINSSRYLKLKNTQIYNNTANKNGGGVYYMYNGSLYMTGCKIYSNTANNNGGGIYLTHWSEATDKIDFKNNNIYQNTAVRGGGIYNARKKTVFLSSGSIYQNTAERGAGVYNIGSFNLNGGEIYSNTASKDGGGVYNTDTFTFNDGTISSNTASEDGGGVYNTDTFTFNDGTISSNTASEDGGGVYNNGGNFNFYEGEISQNTAARGGGVRNTKEGYVCILNVQINNNKAIGNEATATTGNGGGICNFGTLEIQSNDSNTEGDLYGINSNTATNGGGIYNNTGTLTFSGFIEISSNTANNNGGGICNTGDGKLNLNYVFVDENRAAKFGGGVYNTGSFTSSNGGAVIQNNIAYSKNGSMIQGSGGGIYSSTSITFDKSVDITHNTATNGGGVYITTPSGAENVSTLYMTSKLVYIQENIAYDGAGVSLAQSNMVMSNGVISDNYAGKIGESTSTGEGGGINISGNGTYGILTITGGEIYNNIVTSSSSVKGGGVYCHRATINMSGGEIYNNIVTSDSYADGGGIFITEKATLNMSGGEIYKNYADNGGGVALLYYYDSVVNMSGGEIYGNTAVCGGGIFNGGCDNVRITGGKIYSNSAEDGGGVYLEDYGILHLTSNSIYNNTASNKGSGVYVNSPDSVFYMSEAACVGDTDRDGVSDKDDVYLNNNSYISVPSDFTTGTTSSDVTTSKKALRAIVTPDTNNTGRIIAKYTTDETAKGSTALYWNSDNPKMTEQYFTVNNKVLRSGDQGAADYIDTLNNQDVFISEAYKIVFDMNPEDIMMKDTVTHIIGGNKYVFSDLANNHINDNLYVKYWYEQLSFKTGYAETSYASFNYWTTNANGSGSVYNDETITLAAANNNGMTLYAQWIVKALNIDVDYNGNGATKGSNWSEKNINPNDNYIVSSNKSAFERIISGSSAGGLCQFMGWSFNSNATASEYGFGVTLTGKSGVLASNAAEISGRERKVATLYAVWDEFPGIEAVDRWFTLEEAQGGQITLSELLSTASAKDSTVGKYTDFDKGEGTFTIIDFDADSFKNLTAGESTTVTYKAIDKAGNETYKSITVEIVPEAPSLNIDVDYNGNGATTGTNWTKENVDANKDYIVSSNKSAFERIISGSSAGGLCQFMGWSFNSNATASEYGFGVTLTGKSGVLASNAAEISGRERKVATLYAVWDEFPGIEAVDRWFTLEEAQGGQITLSELLSTASAKDSTVGKYTDFDKGEGTFTIINFDADELKSLKTGESVTVTYKAIDKAGNETYKSITVHVVDMAEIDVDYNGNGATKGENWTDENVNANEDYIVSDKKDAFERITNVDGSSLTLAPGLYDSEDNMIMSWDEIKTTYSGAFQETGKISVKLTDNDTIDSSYFADLSGKLVISDEITAIAGYAFNNCTSLTDIILPSDITIISGCTFQNCTSLKSVTIPDKVTVIYAGAFNNCTKLSTIYLPKSITDIYGNICANCISLSNVYYSGTKDDWENIAFHFSNDVLLRANIHYDYVSPSSDPENLRLYQFMGWSFDSEAKIPEYSFGDVLTSEEGALQKFAEETSGRERKVATLYAVWDEFPVIEAVDRWFTLEEAQSGQITLSELLSTAVGKDGVVGDYTDFNKGEGTFTIIDFDGDELKSLKTGESVTVTYQAIDKAGNETYSTITIHIVPDEQYLNKTQQYVRFISDKYFKDSDGNYVLEASGGLNSESKWINNADYETLLNKTLSNTKNDDGEWNEVNKEWAFTPDELTEIKQYIENHGLGNSVESDALKNFYNDYLK